MTIHKVDYIYPTKRITSIRFERDKELRDTDGSEKLIAATEFYKEVIKPIKKQIKWIENNFTTRPA
jgi:hypothetical protein